VISTSPPEVVHFVGHALQRKAGIPWVADYRDLWFAEMRVNQFRLSSWLTGRIKRPKLRQALTMSTVSEGLAGRLGRFVGREVVVCYNGFMPEASRAEQPRPWKDGKRHVVYTGRMFPGKRDPRLFFHGLALALRADPKTSEKLAIDLYGFNDSWIRQSAAQYGVAHCVRAHGLVSHQESLTAQRHADLLLFLDWMDEGAEGILTGKLFEYLATRRPVLGVGVSSETEAAAIIQKAGAGETLTQPQTICERLLKLARQEGTASPAQSASVEQFSRLQQADRLLERIESALASARA
jgi:glycosyltransferase involved in cell wall biosynthesis